MMIVGILVLAAGIALGLTVFFSPGRMQAIGLTADTAAILLTAGLLSIALGGVIAAVESAAKSTQELREWLAGHEASEAPAAAPAKFVAEPEAPVAAPVAAAAAAIATAAAPEVTTAVVEETTRVVEVKGTPGFPPFEKIAPAAKAATEDTLASLEKAKSDLSSALGLPPDFGKKTETKAEPEPEPEAEPEREPELDEAELPEDAEADADTDDEQLYVIEEKLVRGRPARVLSDGTVEAETDEGWMRFENTEHLEEYLDAVSPTKA
jgi:hypothetical protein